MLRLARFVGIGYILICLAVLGVTFVVGPLGYAPFAMVIARARAPVTVTFWYSTEKKEWLDAAVQRFAAANPTANGRPIQVTLKGLGSREMAERVARKDWGNDTPPTVISPASSLWIEMLKSEWAKQSSAPIIAGTPQPLVLTPLVVLGWEDRVKLLWANGTPPTFWRDLHDALVKDGGWKALGGQETWGPVKFGHTSPLTSNSGTQTLLLLAYGYHNKTRGLNAADVQNPDFQKWLVDVEGAVPQFGESTGTFVDDMIRYGPSKYDFVVVYENLAIQSFDKSQTRGGDLHVYYPPATLFSDHPFATLQGDWTTDDERAAANTLRDFLLTRPIQELALQYGFRPADPNVSITSADASNPFNKYKSFGVQTDIAQQVELPPGNVLNALLAVWQSKINR